MKEEKTNSKRITISDVAKAAGVVPSTVSHVLNGTAHITEETKERVLSVIRELNYTPNASARALRQKRTRLIGVALQNISIEFYAKCTASLLKEARKDKYVLLLMDATFDNEVLKEEVAALIERRVEGLIFIGGNHDDEILQSVAEANIPIVLGDRHSDVFSTVEFNNEETMYQMACALYHSGYRKFAYLGEALDVQSNLADRYNGFKRGLDACNVPEEDRIVILDEVLHVNKLQNGYDMFAETFLEESRKVWPDVIVTSNDLIAQGLMSALVQRGIRVPEDVGIVGFDDIEISKYLQPSLTTITQDEKQLACCCYQLLKDTIMGKKKAEHIVLQQRIVNRKSTKIKDEFLV